MVDRNEFIARKAEFAELYSICFNCEMTTSEIEWRYLSNPYCHILACFAYDDDKLIANYSVSPIRLMVDGIVIITRMLCISPSKILHAFFEVDSPFLSTP